MTSTNNNEQLLLIFLWIFYGVVCQIINVFGIITNIINIICFVNQGFKDSVNISLLGLSVSDLGSLTTMVWTCICLTPAVSVADLPFDPVEIGYLTSGMAHFAFTRVSSCLTAMIVLERCLCITAPLKIKRIITPTKTAVITVCIFITFFTSTPVYIVNSLQEKFSILRNKTIIGLVSTDNRENVEKISFAINNFAIPLSAFVVIVVCTSILSFQLKRKNEWRQKIISREQDVKVSGRNQKLAKMIVLISIVFIICFVPVSVTMLVVSLVPELSVYGKYMFVSMICGGLGYALESINTSVNIFIYYQMSSNYRKAFLNSCINHKGWEQAKLT